MMKKTLTIMAMAVTTITAVSCGTVTRMKTEEEGLKKAKDMTTIMLYQKYSKYSDNISVDCHMKDDEVINYYVTYTRPIKHTNWDGEEDYINMTYVIQCDENGKETDWNIGYTYDETMSYFAELSQ